ncbi:hypothetical protein TSUD_334710 [Trifolium subterraneum]|uniref:Cupin type-1 domain-containing protein n=1 Tax=Trifolium subterraneum TaxID=3900 RepID=A0A2Z6LK10_TRISU|nr:hypothetical protein TSUD_334710 [Trifolium subterraneum]
MAKLLALSISLCFLLFGSCFAFRGQQPQQNECQLEHLNPLEPDNRVESEGGLIETWNPNNRQFRCAGFALSRATIQRNSLRRPYYSNAPQEIFIQQGNGYFGLVFPGCPETFEEPQESQQGEGRRFRDSHQKVNRFREGDIIAVPTGVAFWLYNDQETPRFYLAGNHEQEFLRYQKQQVRGKEEQESEGSNIFSGFKRDFLEDALNVNRHIVDRLQGRNEDEEKGAIVKVKGGLSIISPPERQPRHQSRSRQDEDQDEDEDWQARPHKSRREQDEDEDDEKHSRHHHKGGSRRQQDNGIEETICSAKYRQNIGLSSSPDIYNPQAGRIKTVTSLDLPILKWIKLSAEHGSLHKNAIFVPHYNLNANSAIYALRGRAWLQVVNHNGNTVFDGELEAGRVLIVPQNFAVAAKSLSDKFQYVSFKTNDRAAIARLAGSSSTLNGLPLDVLAATFNLERNEARQLKNNNPFKFLVPPRESESRASA